MINRNITALIQRWRSLLPCQLCGLERQFRHSFCQDCWRALPWYLDLIRRHHYPILAACHYEFPMDRIIQKFKYEQQLHYQYILAGCLLNLDLPQVDAIVPMPISEKRLIERGYNQMMLIAAILSKQLQLPIWQPIIRAHQHSQKGLTRLERIQGIAQQFQINPNFKQHYARVLIIDDVVTTGSSNAALVERLQLIGCTQIHTACIAAAQHH